MQIYSMLIQILAVLCFASGVLSIKNQTCVKNPGSPPEKITFDDCDDFPCYIKYHSTVRLTYQLTLPHAVSKIEKEVWHKLGDGPLVLVRIMDGCEFIKCPVEAGQTVLYSKILGMPDDLPIGLQEYEIYFKNGDTKETIACAKYQLIFYDEDDEDKQIIGSKEE